MAALQRALHFGLEEQRQHAEGPLIEAIRACASSRFSTIGFSRIVDYRYSFEPLSTAGSLKAEGGSLQKQLLDPNWRVRPIQFDLPANSQIFGRLVAAAGIHGVLYPSSKDLTRRCLALFPQNWSGSSSYAEVSDPKPPEARVTRLDRGNT